MLMHNSGWDEVSSRGNPTKSMKANHFIQDLVKMECHECGVSSQARQPIEFNNFLTLLQLARTEGFSEEFGSNRRGKLKWSRLA